MHKIQFLTRAKIFTSIMILSLLLVALYAIILKIINNSEINYFTEDEFSSDKDRNFIRMLNPSEMELSGCEFLNCSVECVACPNIKHCMDFSMQNMNCAAITTLKIIEKNSDNKTLTRNWANDDTKILEITFEGGNLESIDHGFDNIAFSEVLTLLLDYIPLKTLESDTLLGLPNLENLGTTCPLETISSSFFQPVRTTLIFLRMKDMTDKIQFDNLFGVSVMQNLEVLDLAGNHFVQPLTIKGFKMIPSVKRLILSQCHIKAFGPNAFNPIKHSLKQLELTKNNLITLDFDTFNDLLKERKVLLYIKRNPWKCNCNLKSLLDLFETYKDLFIGTPVCTQPQINFGDRITDVQLCDKAPMPTYTSSETTYDEEEEPSGNTNDQNTIINAAKTTFMHDDTSSTSTTEGQAEKEKIDGIHVISPASETLVQLSCFNNIKSISQAVDDNHSVTEEMSRGFLYFDTPDAYFHIILESETSVRINFDENCESFSIVYFNTPNSFNTSSINTKNNCGCVSPFDNFLFIENLQQNTTYTFCLVKDEDEEISPFNCLPFFIPVAESKNLWLNNKQKPFYIGAFCLILLISLFSGAGSCFLMLKFHPNLLKGSKHVIMVKKNAAAKICRDSISTNSTSRGSFENMNRESAKSDLSFLKQKRSPTPPTYLESQFSNDDNGKSYMRPIEILENNSYASSDKFSDEEIYGDGLLGSYPSIPPPLPKRNSIQPLAEEVSA